MHAYTVKFYNDDIAPARVASLLAEEINLPQVFMYVPLT